MFNAYVPKITLPAGKSDIRKGGGIGIICEGQVMLVDGFEGGEPTNGMKAWLAENGVSTVNTAVLTHVHYDHYHGLLEIEEDSRFHIELVLMYDPLTLKHGCDGSRNGRAVQEDMDNAYKFIRAMQSHGTKVRWIDKGGVVKCGDTTWKVYRNQPREFTIFDDGNAYAFVNDGSLVLCSPEVQLLFGGDGCVDLEDAIAYFKQIIVAMYVLHHGNNCPESDAHAAKEAGVVLMWETNVERDGAGTTDFTMYGSRRVVQQGIPVWMQNEPIYITAANGKITFKQGSKTVTAKIPYDGKCEEGWVHNHKGWWYKKEDGSFYTGWAKLKWSKGVNYFYFDKEGYMVTGWRRIKWSGGTSWFFFDWKDGYMRTGWQKVAWSKGTNWFYFDPKDGDMQTGWLKYNGFWYFLDKTDGYMVTGWINWNGKRCYLDPISGKAAQSCTREIDGQTYTFDDGCYVIGGSVEEPEIIPNDGFKAGRNCGNRSEKIQYIVVHYTGSEGSAANNIKYFNSGNRGASAHYFVNQSGEIREYCDPALYYAWHCGGSIESSHHPLYGICTNRNSIGIEICTHNNGGTWEFTEAAVNAAIVLTKYLMAKFGIDTDHVCRHYDVTGKACPRVPGWGAVGGSAKWEAFKAALSAVSETPAEPLTDNEKFIEEIGAMAKEDMAKSGICAAITVAQAILESGWGKSELAVNARNIFGMKCSLSGNTWPGSSWDGKSAYNKSTGEYYSGSYTTVKANFRVYKSWSESVADHSAYLAGAKNGSALRYAGLIGCSDYKTAAQIIKNGGYATSPTYVEKLCNLVEQYDLTKYNI